MRVGRRRLDAGRGTRVVHALIEVAKAALEATSRYLAVELAGEGIRVNVVRAGLVEGSSLEAHPGYAALVAEARRRTPLGRLATAEAIADAVLWLSSEAASTVTGQVITIDGGAGLLA